MKNQLTLNVYRGSRGGRRPNAGRKRQQSVGVANQARPKISSHYPLHINFKYCTFIRTDKVLKSFDLAIENALRFNFSVTHFTIQNNHIHLIAETNSTENLIKGMRSITNTLVKRIGKGSIQVERYHLHILKTPLEVKNATQYVLTNDLKHGTKNEKKFSQKISSGTCWLLKTHSH